MGASGSCQHIRSAKPVLSQPSVNLMKEKFSWYLHCVVLGFSGSFQLSCFQTFLCQQFGLVYAFITATACTTFWRYVLVLIAHFPHLIASILGQKGRYRSEPHIFFLFSKYPISIDCTKTVSQQKFPLLYLLRAAGGEEIYYYYRTRSRWARKLFCNLSVQFAERLEMGRLELIGWERVFRSYLGQFTLGSVTFWGIFGRSSCQLKGHTRNCI